MPRIPDMKKVYLCQKYRKFIPDTRYPMICPKHDDDTINKVNEKRQNKVKKRVKKLKTLKGLKCIIEDENKNCINDAVDDNDNVDDIDDIDDIDNTDDDTNKK